MNVTTSVISRVVKKGKNLIDQASQTILRFKSFLANIFPDSTSLKEFFPNLLEKIPSINSTEAPNKKNSLKIRDKTKAKFENIVNKF